MATTYYKTTRSRTLVEMQPYMFTYGAAMSAVSPLASLYQLLRLNPAVQITTGRMCYMSGIVFLPQTVLKAIQMNISTPVRKNINPWAAFWVIGVLQGGVYGQANIYFSQSLGLVKKANYANLFRGFVFGGFRDVVSQGVPFVCSAWVRDNVVESLFTDEDRAHRSDRVQSCVHWGAILSTSVVSTYLSQFFQNCQISMQANPTLGYIATVKDIFARNGIAAMYRGAEARVGLLIVANTLNELVLKPAWSEVEQEEV